MASPEPKRKSRRPIKTLDELQSERFEATAQLLGADQTGAGFERALKVIVPPKAKNPRKSVKT